MPASFAVTNPNDAGTGSLRAAITAANAAGGSNTVDFAPVLLGQTIALASTLPTITTTMAMRRKSFVT